MSEPGYGQRTGPQQAANGQDPVTSTGSTGGTGLQQGSSQTDRAQKGGASRESGGSPGTVGGVAGPTGPTGQADAVASGRVATSPEDVRRQSENRPTAAASAAKGGEPSTGQQASAEDRVSQAKSALQRAVDLNAKGDAGCSEAVRQARELAPQQGR